MKQPEQEKAFEKVLLLHTEMCYSVALTLTRNPRHAHHLTRHVLTCAWHLRGTADGAKGIKQKLLTLLRKTFLKKSGQAPCERVNKLRQQGTLCFAEDNQLGSW